jgi:NAD-dependent deacetylase
MPTTTVSPLIPSELVDLLSSAEKVAFLTGSGISAESGVPTFRDAQTGLWAQYNPQELATPEAFARNPRLVWQWYEWRRQLIADALPNPAHTALVELEQLIPHFRLISQNVDGLHQKAGSESIIELHGNILRTKCYEDGEIIEKWGDDDRLPPHCPTCDGLLRPDVVWFGEALPYEALSAALVASQNCDLFFSAGTSSVVQPAASLADQARQSGAMIIEINLAPTPLTPFADFVLSGPAGQILSMLVDSTFHK